MKVSEPNVGTSEPTFRRQNHWKKGNLTNWFVQHQSFYQRKREKFRETKKYVFFRGKHFIIINSFNDYKRSIFIELKVTCIELGIVMLEAVFNDVTSNKERQE